jgi:diacylglycerol kinase
MSKKEFSVRSRAESFAFAFSGFMVLVRTQHNFWLHLVAAAFAVFLSSWLQISRVEFSLIVLSIALVLVTEALNTAIEMTVNMATAQRTWPAKWAKDIAAAAVLIAAAGALTVGLTILGPPLYDKMIEML